MGQNSKSNWTQHARNAALTKDFAAFNKRLAKSWETPNFAQVQCSKCKDMHTLDKVVRLPMSNLHICDLCIEQES